MLILVCYLLLYCKNCRLLYGKINGKIVLVVIYFWWSLMYLKVKFDYYMVFYIFLNVVCYLFLGCNEVF